MKTIILDDENPLTRVDAKKMEVPIHNPIEGYIFNCSQSLSLVSTAVDKTKLSIKWLERSYENSPDDDEVTSEEYIECAIENYFVRSGAIYDRCLILVSSLHDLGIANESIGHSLIVTNSHVKKSGIAEKLKGLRKVCTEYRIERNKIVHHGRYSEELFNKVFLMHKVNSYHKLQGKELVYGQELIDELTHGIIDIQVDEFQEHIDKITEKLNGFFDLAEKVYLMRKDKIRA